MKKGKTSSDVVISGNFFIKYIDEIESPARGDVLFYLNDDSTSSFTGDYETQSKAGYFKAKIFDGKDWGIINLNEFLEKSDYSFSKKEKAIDRAGYIIDLMSGFQNTIMYKTYRGHFTIHKYEKNGYSRKSDRKNKKLSKDLSNVLS